MPSLNKNLIQTKLADLQKYLAELEPLTTLDFKTYQADYIKRHATEKLIELIVEIASDINRDFIEAFGRAPASTYFDTFEEMREIGILPIDLAPKLASTAGLRNRLVHRYEKINHKAVHQTLDSFLHNYNYKQYFVLINDYLRRFQD